MRLLTYAIAVLTFAAASTANLHRRQAAAASTDSLVYESMPVSSLSSPISFASTSTESSSTLSSAGSSPPSSATANPVVTQYMSTSVATASYSSTSTSGKYSNTTSASAPLSSSSSAASAMPSSTVAASSLLGGVRVTTADFTTGTSMPTSLVLDTATGSYSGDGGMAPTSTYTSWDIVSGGGGGSTVQTAGASATGTASAQDRPSRGVRKARVPAKASIFAMGVLMVFMVLFA